MANKKNLENAKKNKNDEFYTRREDIERELKNYRDHFNNKTVFCNCDDPEYSNFYFFFKEQFDRLKLKKLITIHYNKEGNSYKLEISRNSDGIMQEPVKSPLSGNGDFRSDESTELLKESDIVVTNPPFSLFREYVLQLIEYEKKFLIIGHQNAISYKEIFKLIKENKLWLGFGFKGNAAHFINKHYEDYASASDHKEGMIRVSGVTWFTNLDHSKRHEFIDLWSEYDPELYPKYDHYNAININESKNIPKNYFEPMGVPITFLSKLNPEQFEIIDCLNPNSILYPNDWKQSKGKYLTSVNGVKKYARMIIRNKGNKNGN